MAEHPLLKDQFNPNSIAQLADIFVDIEPQFQRQQFIAAALAGLEKLELKDRVQQVIHALAQVLPDDFAAAAPMLIQAGQRLVIADNSAGWNHYLAWPLIDYVSRYGQQHNAVALPALAKLTPLFTAEFAIRPWVKNQFEAVYPQLQSWTQHEDPHLRRLASEAVRPRLPWAEHLAALKSDPRPIIPLLEQLKDDDSDYVRKSVANNLNDISKDHPELLLDLCERWLTDSPSAPCKWIVRRGLRTLVKQGNRQALALLGYQQDLQFSEKIFEVDKTVLRAGDTITLQLSLSSAMTQKQPLKIDYALIYPLQQGKTGRKIFSWTERQLSPEQVISLTKRHLFTALSTRRLRSGKHHLKLLINGQCYARQTIELIV
jgi:3-methyladenine DNA glycosylase AlkC